MKIRISGKLRDIGRQIALCVLCIVTICMLTFRYAKADSGPKPSVTITFENMGEELCYGTLLSESNTTGPCSAWDGTKENQVLYDLDEDVWNAFVNYKDCDGYYFLQRGWVCSKTKKLDWTYYPPTTFKILLYYPKTNTFVVSDIYEKYAFDSRFKVNMQGIDIGRVEAQTPVLLAEKSYDYTGEAISLVCRIILTILLEIGIAFLFGLGERNLLLWIAGINMITQILLNVWLNLVNYKSGHYAYMVTYINLEILVFVVEAALYGIVLNRFTKKTISGKTCVLYSLAANAGSFAAGSLLAKWIPMIF